MLLMLVLRDEVSERQCITSSLRLYNIAPSIYVCNSHLCDGRLAASRLE